MPQEDIKQLAADFAEDTVSLYIPRPAIEAHGEKWRILKKNLMQQLQDHDGPTDRIESWLNGVELQDFLGQGKAAFQKGDALKTADLNARPQAMISGPGPALITPLLADVDGTEQAWIVEINREAPKLYFYNGSEIEDCSQRFDATEYEEVLARREIMDDVFFHSVSRGGTEGSKFHALGTDKEAESEKTDDAYYRDVWSAVEQVIPAQTRTIHVVGNEGTVGHFCALNPRDNWELVQHQSGKGIQAIDTAEFRAEAADIDDHALTAMNAPDLREAAQSGRISAIYLHPKTDLLEHADEGRRDEHLRLMDISEDLGAGDRLDDVILSTVQNGGEVRFIPSEAISPIAPLIETRW